jgi:hypothetical protein
MTLPTDYVDGDVLTAADVNAITVAVNSNTNGKIAVGTFDAKGDLLVGLTNDSVGRLAVGTNGYLLSASSGATSGLQWVPAGGKVLGFAYDTDSTERSTTSTTAVDITGLSVTYTPISASSNLVVDLFVNAEVAQLTGAALVSRRGIIRLTDGSSNIDAQFGRDLASADGNPTSSYAPVHIRYVFPSTGTTSRTFKGQFYAAVTNLTVYAQNDFGPATISVMEVAA